MSYKRNFNILSTHRKNFCVNLAGKEPNNYWITTFIIVCLVFELTL